MKSKSNKKPKDKKKHEKPYHINMTFGEAIKHIATVSYKAKKRKKN